MQNNATGVLHRGDLGKFVFATVLVAILDISFAATYWVVYKGVTTFPRLLQSIATGIEGKAAFAGGTRSMLVGAVSHVAVAAGWTALFLLLARTVPAFSRALARPNGVVLVGALYGVAVWLAMDLLVLPLTHASPTPIAATWFWVCLAWHAVGVGPPMAVVFRR